MNLLTDLTPLSPQLWDEHIRRELEAATVKVHQFREYDSPGYSVNHTLKGTLGQWTFSRNEVSYVFWGDIPLATAEMIALHPDCAVGCMPKQWLSNWSEKPNVADVHAKLADHIVWMDGAKVRTKDEGFSELQKQVLQRDAQQKLLFVDNPSVGGKPFIRTYTFFTEAALSAFMAIVRRHRVDFTHRY